MPGDAKGLRPAAGSSPRATVTRHARGRRGPFAPGSTFVQVGCEMPAESGGIDIEQRFPAALSHLAVVVKKWARPRCDRRSSRNSAGAGGRRSVHRGDRRGGGGRPADRAGGQRRAASQPDAAPRRADAGARHHARRRVDGRPPAGGRPRHDDRRGAEAAADAPRQAVQRSGPARERIDRTAARTIAGTARREEIVGALERSTAPSTATTPGWSRATAPASPRPPAPRASGAKLRTT